MIYNSINDLVGKTPLLKANNLKENLKLNFNLYAKLELFNPASSVKDRIALRMIIDGENSGKINSDTTIIEPTSGNTGIGIAAICASKGYKVIIVMPETMSDERKKIIKAYGAELVLTEGSKGMKGAISKANELAEEIDNSFIPSQFENKSNPIAHFETTGPEIWSDLDGKIDILVAGIGTGGTITGVGSYLKKMNPDIKVVGVEPTDSPVLNGGSPGPHGIQGIGAGFVPNVLNTEVFDSVEKVSTEDAFKYSRLFAQNEGVLVGISSGAALSAAIKIGNENKGKNVVVILPDSGERYLSTALYKL